MSTPATPTPASNPAPGMPTLTQAPQRDREAEFRPLDMKLIVRLLGYTRPYAAKRNWLLVMVLLRSVQLPLLAWLLAAIIQVPIAQHNMKMLYIASGAYLLLALITNLTMHFRVRWGMELGEAVVHDLRNELFAHLHRMPMSFFNKTKLGRIISRMTSDAEAVRAGAQEVLFVTIVSLGQMVVASILMAWTDWVLFTLVLATGITLWGLNRIFRMSFAKAYRDMQESFSRVTATLAESVGGIRVTQGFVRQDVNAKMFGKLVADHSSYNIIVQNLQGIFLPLLEFNSQFFNAALLLVGGYRILMVPDSTTSPESLVFFFFLANLFFANVQGMGTQYNQALVAMAGAERVFKLLDTKPQWVDAPDAVVLPPIQGKVQFKNLNFSYDPGKPVLRDVNFTAKPGQTIALVGHTGSGKSSIINLISKFYLPDSGQLLIDDLEIRQIQSDSLHKQMGIVLQVNFLFSGTVMDNIKVSKPDATDADVFEAARKLDCLDLLEALPQGLYSSVGERGSGLSLGQRQLICFTRSMLADPRILILDEATSSVDTMTEARIQKALAVLLKGRTSFVVAHRLSTIRHADVVLVLDHGRIVERGTHNQLLITGGIYANLYRQFIRASEA